MIKENRFWEITREETLREFCKQARKEDLIWSSGSFADYEPVIEAIVEGGFPVYIEVDKERIFWTMKKPNNYSIFEKIQSELIDLQPAPVKQPGIYFVDENHNEQYFTFDAYLKDTKRFAEKVKAARSFRIGEYVCVVDEGQIYSTYYDWFEENNIPVKIAARYVFNPPASYSIPKGTYEIVAKGPHCSSKEMLYAIQPLEDKCCIAPCIYLINHFGLASAKA